MKYIVLILYFNCSILAAKRMLHKATDIHVTPKIQNHFARCVSGIPVIDLVNVKNHYYCYDEIIGGI